MDGYALCTNEATMQTEFTVIGRIAAGDDAADFELNMGQAVRIFTGALHSRGANTVIAQEHTEVKGDVLHCTRPQFGQHIRRRGEDIRAHDALLHAGQMLSPQPSALPPVKGMHMCPPTLPCV